MPCPARRAHVDITEALLSAWRVRGGPFESREASSSGGSTKTRALLPIHRCIKNSRARLPARREHTVWQSARAREAGRKLPGLENDPRGHTPARALTSTSEEYSETLGSMTERLFCIHSTAVSGEWPWATNHANAIVAARPRPLLQWISTREPGFSRRCSLMNDTPRCARGGGMFDRYREQHTLAENIAARDGAVHTSSESTDGAQVSWVASWSCFRPASL